MSQAVDSAHVAVTFRATYRCGACGWLGHNRRTCPVKRYRGKRHDGSNEAYAANRAAGLCDDCGRRSRKSRCPRCVARRKRWPSRQKAYRRENER